MTNRLLAAFACVLALAVPASAQDPTTTGALSAAGDTVVVSMINVPSVAAQIAGSSGLVAFEATVDGGSTWWPVGARAADGSTVYVTATPTGLFVIQNAGYTHVRFRGVNAGGSTTVTVTRGFSGGAPPGVPPVSTMTTKPAPLLPLPACNPITKVAGNCRS